MASRALDVVARLQLRAEQFSSESGKAFADMTARARAAAGEIETSFNSSFAEVQRLTSSALKIPDVQGGRLNLAGEIASLEESAKAAERASEAHRTLSIAMQTAATSGGAGAAALRVEADAAAVASLAEERNADAIRDRITALRSVQVELDRLHPVVDAGNKVLNDGATISQRHANGVRNLGQQFGDMAVMIQGGIDPARAFATQAGQMGFAMSELDGRMGKVGAYLTGPLGIAVTIGVAALAPLASKLFETNDALEKEVENLRKSAAQADVTARAKEAYRQTTEGVIESLNKEIEATQRLIAVQRTQAEQQNVNLKNGVDENKRKRADVAEQLIGAQEDLARRRRLQDRSGEFTDPKLVAADAKVTELLGQLADLDAKITAGERAIQQSRIALAAERAKDVTNQQKQIDNRFDAERDALTRRLDAATAEGRVIGDASQRQFEDIERRRAAAHEIERKRQQERLRNERDIAKTRDTPTTKQLVSTVRDLFPGVSIGSTTRSVEHNRRVGGAPNSHHLRGTAVDFVPAGGMGSLTKAQVRAAVEARGLQIAELLGPGDKGHSDHFHLAIKGGKAALDNYAASQKVVLEAQRELNSAYQSTVSALDPARASLERYRDTLNDIASLAKAGRISPEKSIEYLLAAQGDYEAGEQRRREQRFTDAFGADEINSTIGRFDTAIDRIGQGFADRGEQFAENVIEGARTAEQIFGDVIGRASGLFGIRLGGPITNLFAPDGVRGQSNKLAADIGTSLRTVGIRIDDRSIQRLEAALGAAAYGQIGGSVFASITGGKNNALASGLGGVVGDIAGKEIGKAVSTGATGLLKTLGGAAGPIGAVLGGVLGNVVGGLFAKAPKGSAGVVIDPYGTFQAGAATGNNSQARSGAATLAGSVSAGLNQIAELLGAQVTGRTDVQIGIYDGKFRVNDHGGAIGGVKGSGAISFATEEAAISYAISDALKDGVLSGISQASLNILRSGQDLQRSIEKAVLIESIPRALKAATDPLGAAVDEVNRKFEKIVAALKEGGASAEQMAQAQQLYNVELGQAKASAGAAAQSLKDFLTEMKGGSNSPYSLRVQEQNARAALSPFLSAIEAGQTIDQGKYQSAAQAFLDIERQLYGSGAKFFEAFDAVQAATEKAIRQIDNAVPITPGVPDPFTKATAAAAEATARAAQTGNEMTGDTNTLLATNNALMQRLLAAVESGALSDFIGSGRGFAEAA